MLGRDPGHLPFGHSAPGCANAGSQLSVYFERARCPWVKVGARCDHRLRLRGDVSASPQSGLDPGSQSQWAGHKATLRNPGSGWCVQGPVRWPLCQGVREAGQGLVMGRSGQRCAQAGREPAMRSRQKAEGRAWNPQEKVLEDGPTLSTHAALTPRGPARRRPGRRMGSRVGRSSADLCCPATPLADEGLWDMFVKDIPRSATSYTVSLDRLRPGVTYEFRVVAVNQVGYGEPSSPSTAVSGRNPPGRAPASVGRGDPWHRRRRAGTDTSSSGACGRHGAREEPGGVTLSRVARLVSSDQ